VTILTTPHLSRRTLLLGSGAALTASGMVSAAGASPRGVVGADQLSAWNEKLASFGVRLTGSRGHAQYVDWLADKFEQTGLKVNRDRLTFTRWAPKRWALEVGGAPVDVAFYWPYSGVTPPSGITAPLAYLGVSPLDAALWATARGKIAVVEVATPPLPIGAVFPETGRYSPDMTSPELLVAQPGVSDIVAAPLLEMAGRAGVLGVVCIRTGVSDAFAADQYSPFTTGYMDCPAIWLGPTAGASVRLQALAGATATLTMHATLTKNVATDTVWAVLPGSDPSEAVVVNTHTDGPNVPEENGGLGLLALAREFSRVPRSKRRRSIIFVATTGHFQLPQFAIGGGQSASRWISDHRELVNGKRSLTVAALTLEHLGCTEWLDDVVTNSYGPNGRKDVAYCFTTTPTMQRLYLAGCVGTGNNRTVTAQPVIYVGEGHDFHSAGVATASLIPGMTYLVQSPRGLALDRVDARYMKGQIRTFANVLRSLDRVSAADIGTPAF